MDWWERRRCLQRWCVICIAFLKEHLKGYILDYDKHLGEAHKIETSGKEMDKILHGEESQSLVAMGEMIQWNEVQEALLHCSGVCLENKDIYIVFNIIF